MGIAPCSGRDVSPLGGYMGFLSEDLAKLVKLHVTPQLQGYEGDTRMADTAKAKIDETPKVTVYFPDMVGDSQGTWVTADHRWKYDVFIGLSLLLKWHKENEADSPDRLDHIKRFLSFFGTKESCESSYGMSVSGEEPKYVAYPIIEVNTEVERIRLNDPDTDATQAYWEFSEATQDKMRERYNELYAENNDLDDAGNAK
jgi:hypothetical protein